MTIHLTYNYLWVLLGIVWLVGVACFNRNAVNNGFGELDWLDRLLVWTWPVSVPLAALYFLARELFWP